MHMQLAKATRTPVQEPVRQTASRQGESEIDLRLFEGDRCRAALGRIGLSGNGFIGRLSYMLVPVVVGWLPLVFLNVLADPRPVASLCERVYFDLGGIAQYLVVLPLLIWSEFFVDHHASITGRRLVESGVVSNSEALERALRGVGKLRRSLVPEFTCIMGAYVISGLMIGTELYGGGSCVDVADVD